MQNKPSNPDHAINVLHAEITVVTVRGKLVFIYSLLVLVGDHCTCKSMSSMLKVPSKGIRSLFLERTINSTIIIAVVTVQKEEKK